MRMSERDALDLMRLHVEAEFVHDATGALVRVNEPDGAPAPRFFVGVTRDGVVTRYRYDVDAALRLVLERESDRLSGLERSPSPERFEQVLRRAAPILRMWTGPAFTFPDELSRPAGAVRIDASNASILEDALGDWIPDVDRCQPMLAKVVDGRAVSLCASVRRTPDAHEAGVETAVPFRRLGFASAVAAAWAEAVRAMGPVPLYSTSWQNAASRAVARKVGLIHFGNDLHIT